MARSLAKRDARKSGRCFVTMVPKKFQKDTPDSFGAGPFVEKVQLFVPHTIV
jgi:hypothetical protein